MSKKESVSPRPPEPAAAAQQTDLWVPVPSHLQPILQRHLDIEFGVSRLSDQSNENIFALSEEGKTFGRLLVQSSVFFPGADLERAKRLELKRPELLRDRQDSFVRELDPAAVAALEKDLGGVVSHRAEELDHGVAKEVGEGLGQSGRSVGYRPAPSPPRPAAEAARDDTVSAAGGHPTDSRPADLLLPNQEEGNPASHERALWTQFLRQELRSLQLRKSEPPLVLFVLGPSAAGKTFGAKQLMRHQRSSDEIARGAVGNSTSSAPDGAAGDLVSIDGAAMRGASRTWVEFSIHVVSRFTAPATVDGGVPGGAAPTAATPRHLAGFSDLYETYFKPYLERLKTYFVDAILQERLSCVIPHTARNSKKFCRAYVDRFGKSGYRMQVLGVVASVKKCLENGREREKVRGKQYSSEFHSASVASVRTVVNYCHERANHRRGGFDLLETKIQHASCWDCPYTQVIRVEEEISVVGVGACPGQKEGVCRSPEAHEDAAESPLFVVRQVVSTRGVARTSLSSEV